METCSEWQLHTRNAQLVSVIAKSLIHGCLIKMSFPILRVIVITFYSPCCLGLETANGPFGLRLKLLFVYHVKVYLNQNVKKQLLKVRMNQLGHHYA